MRWFAPQPSAAELPLQFPNPFDEAAPHPLALRAARELMAELGRVRDGGARPGAREASGVGDESGAGPGARDTPGVADDSGKMFGVLVVRDASGRVGYLSAFSALLNSAWCVDGFVPPVFDRAARALIEPEGDICVKRLGARLEALRASSELSALRSERELILRRHAQDALSLRARHSENRRWRQSERQRAGTSHALDQLSRADKAEARRVDAQHAEQLASVVRPLVRLERRVAALERLRQMVSRRLMRRLHGTYLIRNARGESRPLRELFAPGEPPSGAADCAGPKLLTAAFSNGLTPLALAEFWWGPSPRTGGRLQGNFYPACKTKCSPLLPFMLAGLSVTERVSFAPAPSAHLELRTVFEDEAFVVVEKPAGLLSVPSRDEAISDCVLSRLRAKFSGASGPMIVHRLDLDTSGLLVAALDIEAYSALQRQFARREVEKRYVAWLDGEVVGDAGTIDLALRVDLEDRPRQIHDPVHGLRAVTEWRVLGRSAGRTCVELFPITGRTHQLRVHAAHPLGLGVPIVGDRLYGRGGDRLMLHAASISFRHPRTGELIRFEVEVPF